MIKNNWNTGVQRQERRLLFIVGFFINTDSLANLSKLKLSNLYLDKAYEEDRAKEKAKDLAEEEAKSK